MVTFLSLAPATLESRPALPTELIWRIIDSLVPSGSTLIPRDHPITRTLLSLSLASRLTHYRAHELLLMHCVHINSPTVIERFNAANDGCIPDCGIHHRTHTKAMYLAPFEHRNQLTTDPVREIDTMLSMLAGSLRRLILDFPWRGFWPDHGDLEPTIILACAFRRLSALEEFVSLADDLPLDLPQEDSDYEPLAWSTWPRLRRLSLNHPCINEEFVEALVRCPHLTHLVFNDPRELTRPLPAELAERVSWERMGLERVTVVYNIPHDYWGNIRRYRARKPQIDKSFLGRLIMTLREGKTAVQPELGCVDMSFDELYENPPGQSWLRERAIDGTIWDFPGVLYEPVA
ncbi:hypothetical protein BJX64DRAFT_291283 [Aspergillus heterothallicus]